MPPPPHPPFGMCNPDTINTVMPGQNVREDSKKMRHVEICQLPPCAAANPMRCETSTSQCTDFKRYSFLITHTHGFFLIGCQCFFFNYTVT